MANPYHRHGAGGKRGEGDCAGRWKLSLIPASTQAVDRFVKRQEAQEGG